MMDVDEALRNADAIDDMYAVPTVSGVLAAEVRRLRGGLQALQHLHRRSDDDPAGPPYCPECQAYDGTGQPCETLRVVEGLLGTPAPEVS